MSPRLVRQLIDSRLLAYCSSIPSNLNFFWLPFLDLMIHDWRLLPLPFFLLFVVRVIRTPHHLVPLQCLVTTKSLLRNLWSAGTFRFNAPNSSSKLGLPDPFLGVVVTASSWQLVTTSTKINQLQLLTVRLRCAGSRHKCQF